MRYTKEFVNLRVQVGDGAPGPALVGRRVAIPRDLRLLVQKLQNTLLEGAGPVAVDDEEGP
jgi:hypothetical protein